MISLANNYLGEGCIMRLLLPPPILLVSVSTHHVWTTACSWASIRATLRIVWWAYSIPTAASTTRTTTWHATWTIGWSPALRRIGPAAIPSTTPTATLAASTRVVVATAWVPAWWVPVRPTRWTTRLPIVMALWPPGRNWGLRPVHELVGPWSHLSCMGLPWLLNGWKPGVLRWVLEFLALCGLLMLPLLLAFFLCLELVRGFIFGQTATNEISWRYSKEILNEGSPTKWNN